MGDYHGPQRGELVRFNPGGFEITMGPVPGKGTTGTLMVAGRAELVRVIVEGGDGVGVSWLVSTDNTDYGMPEDVLAEEFPEPGSLDYTGATHLF